MKAPKPSPHYITARSYKNYEPSAFTADLANQSDQLLSIFSCGDVDTKPNILNDVVGSTLDLHAPVRTTRIRHRPCPFVSRGIKQLMKTRDLLHRNFFQSRDPSDWSKYKESRDTIKEILRETERNYTFLEVQQNKSNPSSLWKVINRVIPSKNKEPQRVYTKDLKTVADGFNVFFTSVGKTAASLLVILQKLITSLGQSSSYHHRLLEIFLTLSVCRVKRCDALFHLCR